MTLSRRRHGATKTDDQVEEQEKFSARGQGSQEEPGSSSDARRLANLTRGVWQPAVQCTRPLKAYRAPGGGVAFDSKEGYVDRPLELRCGQCTACRLLRAQNWAVRCMHEASLHPQSSFITLTYSEQELPADGSLQMEDLQKFWKRLRKSAGSFRYFACGEYGTETQRPHYHACLFGLDFAEDRVLHSTGGGNRLYVSPLLEKTWGKGFAPVGALTMQSAAYVARYVMKKLTGEKAAEVYGDRRPPFVVMSRRPGIGARWFEKYSSDVYPADEVRLEGRSYRPPRFYDEQLDDQVLEELKRGRVKRLAGRAGDRTPERLRTKEKVAEARLELFSSRKL